MGFELLQKSINKPQEDNLTHHHPKIQDKHFPAVFTDTNATQKHTLTHSLAIIHGGKITLFLNTQCSETESFLYLRLNKLRVFTKPTSKASPWLWKPVQGIHCPSPNVTLDRLHNSDDLNCVWSEL